MNIAFTLFDYFPHGGLQRDCLEIAQKCSAAGHEVTIFTRAWVGVRPEGIVVKTLGCKGWTNVARNQNFITVLLKLLAKSKFDAVVGFNKIPGLDIYFAADPCFEAKARSRSPVYRLTRRYRFYRKTEEAVFGMREKPLILLITDREVQLYRDIYGTNSNRFRLLPPNIDRRNFTLKDVAQSRHTKRRELGLKDDSTLLLFVGSGFRTKGLDRAIRGLASLPGSHCGNTHLVVLGRNKPIQFSRLAKSLGLAKRVHFLGGHDDVPEWMLAADFLVHPARNENTGTVLLESIASGLPVLATDACGYAFHIEKAKAGCITPSPFEQSDFNSILSKMIASPEQTQWRANGLAYAAKEDLYSCHQRAAERIEEFIHNKLAPFNHLEQRRSS
jgi:UDP-glucose:(heptosyl)LPS alpha-1,3-glucosyltransferase